MAKWDDFAEIQLLDRIPRGKSYLKHFEGFVEYRVSEPSGKGFRVLRVYRGDYYRQALPDGILRNYKLLYLGLWIVSAALFLLCASRDTAGNSTWYVVVPEFLALMLTLASAVTIFSYVAAAREMTIHVFWTTSLKLRRLSFASVLSLGAAALATLVFVAANPSAKPLIHLLCVLGFVASGVAMHLVHRFETRMKYQKTPSAEQAPEGAVKIRR